MIAGVCQSWMQMQNSARYIWNFLSELKLTPAAVALLASSDPLAVQYVGASSLANGI